MIIVFASKTLQYDFIVQTSIDYARAKLNFSATTPDSRIEAYSPVLDLSQETGVALVGHGAIGKIEAVTAAEIGAFLARPVGGVTSRLRKLIVTSCYAGTDEPGKSGTSVVNVLAKALEGKGLGGLEIVGYNGPSIKNAQNGLHTTVVNDAKIDKAGELQTALVGIYERAGGAIAPTVGFGGLSAQASHNAAVGSAGFYSTFVNMLDTQRLTLKETYGDKVATVATVLR